MSLDKVMKQKMKMGTKKAQPKAEKKALKAAPANKKSTKPTVKAKASKSRKPIALPILSADEEVMKEVEKIAPKKAPQANPFEMLERDLPKGGKVMKVADDLGETAFKAEKKGMGKLGRLGAAGLAGGAVGLGINALMEGLDAEEGGDADQDAMNAAMQRQGEKTSAKLASEKPMKRSLEASTKKTRLPVEVKQTEVEATLPLPKGKSDEDQMNEYAMEMKRNIPEMEDDMEDEEMDGENPFDRIVKKVMREEFQKAANKSNQMKLRR